MSNKTCRQAWFFPEKIIRSAASESIQIVEGYNKAELLQLNHSQFPSLGFFVSKKVGNQKKKDHFYYISFKSCIPGDLSFFEI